jgi:hypothetical protein
MVGKMRVLFDAIKACDAKRRACVRYVERASAIVLGKL